MMLLLLEALGAALILIGIVWWTMFSGRKNGELPQEPDPLDRHDAQTPSTSASQEATPSRKPEN
jgi:hypothetical protein